MTQRDSTQAARGEDTLATAMDRFIEAVLKVPWGTLSKTELDYLIFALLVEEGRIDLGQTDLEIAGTLFTTPTRIRTLRFRHEQRTSPTLTAAQIARQITAHSVDGETSIFVQVESQYVLDHLKDRMRAAGRLVRSDLTRGLIKVDVVDLFMTLHDLGGFAEGSNEELRSQLNEVLRRQNRKELVRKGASILQNLGAVKEVLELGTAITDLFERAAP